MEIIIAIIWFCIVFLMFTVYAILDGFDIGAGILYPFITRNRSEKEAVHSAIGPVWNGNEAWSIAGGGALFMAFPQVFASGFSGFYLGLIILLWLMLLRALSLELSYVIDNRLWKKFWDAVFFISSALMAFLLGAVLANLVRGVPLDSNGWFFMPLWSGLIPGIGVGMIDCFTALGGFMALAGFAAHGGTYIAMKVDGEVSARAARLSFIMRIVMIIFLVLLAAALPFVQNSAVSRFQNALAVLPAIFAAVAVILALVFNKKGKHTHEFAASSAMFVFVSAAAGTALYPDLLISSIDPMKSMTVHNSLSGGLGTSLVWYLIMIAVVSAYTIFVYRLFKGKIKTAESGGEE